MTEIATKTASDLIYLVSCAVNGEAAEPERCAEMDPEAICGLAKKHLLCAAAAYSLEQVMPLPLYFKEEKKKAIRTLALFEIEGSAIYDGLERRGIWYLPLKGIVLKGCYPKSYFREMLDNDILFDSSKSAEVKALMESRGYTVKSYGRHNHDVYIKPPTMYYEFHRSLFDKKHRTVYFEYYSKLYDRLEKCDGSRFRLRMTNEDFYIYMICHLYKHYTLGGSGLRSLLDIYVFARKYGKELDRGYIEAELQKLDILSFERDISKLALTLFGGGALSPEQESELEFFIGSGSNGTVGNMTALKLKNDDSKKAKLKYFARRVFISGDDLKQEYPFVYRHKALYPPLLVYRPVRGLIRSRSLLVREFKSIKSFKKKNNTGSHNLK